METRRLRVLLLAEKANPDWVSVPLVGWTHVECIRSFADVHLVTHVRNRENILARGDSPDNVTFVRPTPLERALDKAADALEGRGAGGGGATQTAFQVPMYYSFELSAWRAIGGRVAAREFDLVHRVTPVSPVMPSIFAPRCRRAGVPFVLGPLNGGVPWPAALSDLRRAEGEWLSYVRGLACFLPYGKDTRRCASAVFLGSAAVWAEIAPEVGAERCFYMPENAVDMRQFGAVSAAPPSRPLRVAFAGRLVPFKGAELLLRAAAPLIREGLVKLDILGDGIERGKLEALIREQGITGGARLDGWVPHAELHERLAQSTVFCFPSVREFGGAVVMEAMALGLVPVVVDYGGPSEVVTDDTGVRVPVGTQEQIIEGVRSALRGLALRAPDEVRELSRRARERVNSELSIEAKTENTRRVYSWVLGRGPRPDLAPPAHSLTLYHKGAIEA